MLLSFGTWKSTLRRKSARKAGVHGSTEQLEHRCLLTASIIDEHGGDFLANDLATAWSLGGEPGSYQILGNISKNDVDYVGVTLAAGSAIDISISAEDFEWEMVPGPFPNSTGVGAAVRAWVKSPLPGSEPVIDEQGLQGFDSVSVSAHASVPGIDARGVASALLIPSLVAGSMTLHTELSATDAYPQTPGPASLMLDGSASGKLVVNSTRSGDFTVTSELSWNSLDFDYYDLPGATRDIFYYINGNSGPIDTYEESYVPEYSWSGEATTAVSWTFTPDSFTATAAVFNSAGTIVAQTDSAGHLRFTAPADGDYFLAFADSGLYNGTVDAGDRAYARAYQADVELLTPDIVVEGKKFEWNPAAGRVDFDYEIANGALQQDAQIRAYWGNESGTIGVPVFIQTVSRDVGIHHVFITGSQLSAPPVGADRLWLIANEDQVITEPDDNNVNTLDYNPSVEFRAKYDRNSDDLIVGRFFTGVSGLNDQQFTVTVSKELAVLASNVVITIGVGSTASSLTLTQQSDNKLEYVSGNFGPQGLKTDTQLAVKVVKNGQTLTRINGAPLSPIRTIDMEVVPAWMSTLLGTSFNVRMFDPATDSYVFQDTVNLTTSGLKGMVVPKKVPLAGGSANGAALKFQLKVVAPLHAQSTEVTNIGSGTVTFLGHTIALDVPAAGFDVKLNLNPQNLQLASGALTYNHTGTATIDKFFDGKSFGVPKLALAEYTSHMQADVTYTADVKLVVNSSGSLNAAGSKANLDLTAELAGSIELDLTKPAKIVKKVGGLLGKLNVPGLIIDEITDALQDVGVIPKVTMEVAARGQISLHSEVTFPNSITKPVATINGRVKFAPQVTVIPSWFGESTTLDGPQALTDLLAFDETF